MAARPLGMDAKIVDVGDDSVIVHGLSLDIRKDRAIRYTTVYQNHDTQELDKRFGLTGKPVETFSALENSIRYSVAKGKFGDINTGRVLVGFEILARRGGLFVGIPEDEFRAYADTCNPIFDHHSNVIDAALKHNKRLEESGEKPYLRRINVEGTDVIFPANVMKLL